MQKSFTAVVVAVTTLWTAGVAAQTKSAEPWVGTWKTDLAKSTFSPGPAPAEEATITIERLEKGYRTTIASTADGKPMQTDTIWTFDGKDHPVKGAPVVNTTAAYKRIDDRTFEVATKVDGKPTVTTRVSISADGRTMTATQSGTNPQGESVKNVIVAIKQ